MQNLDKNAMEPVRFKHLAAQAETEESCCCTKAMPFNKFKFWGIDFLTDVHGYRNK